MTVTARASSEAPLEVVDVAHYYAFLLDAFARFPHEGLTIRPYRLLPFLAGYRPVGPLLAATAARMRAEAAGALPPPVVLEFGVWRGFSISRLARLFPETTIYGFDSFEGFPDDGRADWKTDFRVERLPRVPANVRLVKGYFEATLPEFAAGLPAGRRIDLVHIDCDIYSSTATIFRLLGPHLGPGSVIVFDELVNYPGFPENEFLAFYLFLRRHGLDFEWFVKAGTLCPLDRLCGRDGLRGSARVFRKAGHYQNVAVRLVPGGEARRRIAAHLRPAKKLARRRPLRQPLVAARLPPRPPGLRLVAPVS